jgi:hypothetical protein
MKECLGVMFERRDDGTFVYSQRQYLLKILQRFGMDECKPCETPCVPKKKMDAQNANTIDATFPSARR